MSYDPPLASLVVLKVSESVTAVSESDESEGDGSLIVVIKLQRSRMNATDFSRLSV